MTRRLIVRALLELDAEIGDSGDSRTQLDAFKAATLLKLFPARGAFQDLVLFDEDFYSKWVVPKIEERLAYELRQLTDVDLVTDRVVADKYAELHADVKALAERHDTLMKDLVSTQQLLHDVLSHRQWAIRQKVAQAEVDNMTVMSTVFDKKLIEVCREIYDIYRSYRFYEALDLVIARTDCELTELQAEFDSRTKKHEVYLKARRAYPEIDTMLEKYQSTMETLKNIQDYEPEDG